MVFLGEFFCFFPRYRPSVNSKLSWPASHIRLVKTFWKAHPVTRYTHFCYLSIDSHSFLEREFYSAAFGHMDPLQDTTPFWSHSLPFILESLTYRRQTVGLISNTPMWVHNFGTRTFPMTTPIFRYQI